jgi:lysophospholipase L1-like esterase
MTDSLSPADLPDDVIGFKYPLPNLARALKSGGVVRIVAMGSSSTAGRGNDVVPYPARLEMYLRDVAAGYRRVDVLNRGVGGEEAIEELKRFTTDILDEAPSLVIWQVGTNAVFHHDDQHYCIETVAEKIAEGIKLLQAHPVPMDIVLIDPQYVTAMLFDKSAERSERMVKLISDVAERAHVNVFHRWALMRHWHVHNNIGFELLVDPTDELKLHQSDASTLRFSVGLRDAIMKAVALVSA